MKNIENGLDDFMNQNNEHLNNIMNDIDDLKNHDAFQNQKQNLQNLQNQLQEIMA